MLKSGSEQIELFGFDSEGLETGSNGSERLLTEGSVGSCVVVVVVVVVVKIVVVIAVKIVVVVVLCNY